MQRKIPRNISRKRINTNKREAGPKHHLELISSDNNNNKIENKPDGVGAVGEIGGGGAGGGLFSRLLAKLRKKDAAI